MSIRQYNAFKITDITTNAFFYLVNPIFTFAFIYLFLH